MDDLPLEPQLGETSPPHTALRVIERALAEAGRPVNALGTSNTEVALRRLWTYILTGK